MSKHPLLTKRRAFLLGLGGLVGAGTVAISNRFRNLTYLPEAFANESRDFPAVGNAPLRGRAAAKRLIYGAATDWHILSKDPGFAASFAQECGILVPESDLKWSTLRPRPDKFRFNKADWLAEFARTHGMLFRGAPLVWHNSMPAWFKEVVRFV